MRALGPPPARAGPCFDVGAAARALAVSKALRKAKSSSIRDAQSRAAHAGAAARASANADGRGAGLAFRGAGYLSDRAGLQGSGGAEPGTRTSAMFSAQVTSRPMTHTAVERASHGRKSGITTTEGNLRCFCGRPAFQRCWHVWR